jgi:predicted RNA-binding Zn-ribbon protein involved in translation (DUF1610 family)
MAYYYWISIWDYYAEHGGKNPKCHKCGKEMVPDSENIRFVCDCSQQIEREN